MKMKFLMLSVLLAILLHYHGGKTMNTSQAGSSTKKQAPKRKQFDLDNKLNKLVKNIRNEMLIRNLIKANWQYGFLLIGDESAAYFETFELPSNLQALMIANSDQQIDLSLLDNFLASVPFEDERTMHVEDTLLGKLYPELYDTYTEKHGHSPAFVLLYSDLMPCDGCTRKIINTMINTYSSVSHPLQWFVAYRRGTSEKSKYINEANTRKNTDLLENEGIRVLRVS